MIDNEDPFDAGHVAGRAKYRKWKDGVNPYVCGSQDANMWALGYDDGFNEAEAQDKSDDYDDGSRD